MAAVVAASGQRKDKKIKISFFQVTINEIKDRDELRFFMIKPPVCRIVV